MSHYDKNLDKNDANFVPLTPLSFLERAKDIYPNYEALIYEDRKYTWSEIRLLSNISDTIPLPIAWFCYYRKLDTLSRYLRPDWDCLPMNGECVEVPDE